MTDNPRPRFGDIIDNHWAGEKNPHRFGIFLKAGHTPHGRMNSGRWWECTDGKRASWRLPVDDRKVVIPTPDHMHPRAALAAARNALAVLLERSEDAFVVRCGDPDCMCAQVAARVEHPAEEANQ